jgi:hypothetical protein
LLGTEDQYRTYRKRKFERGEMEIYAAFHPFNESLRATEPLLPAIAAGLKPGDIILEPWARTGWTAAWLAARFPEQRIVALWEGDSSVLGYKGFAYWFDQRTRPENLDVLFVHPDRGLPFHDGAVGAVFSHDCFHRFGVDTFGAELLRVARQDAPIVLAHTHLSNSEPDPFFARGGAIRHGADYRNWLDRICAGTSRHGWIWSEGDLFGAEQLPPDSPNMSHYNALIFMARPDALNAEQSVVPCADNRRLLLNPLYRLQPTRSVARVERAHLDSMVGHMLDRHPVYVPRLGTATLNLSALDWLLICEIACATRFVDLPRELGLSELEVSEHLAALEESDLVLPVYASAAMTDLQRFHANQLPPTSEFLDLTELCRRSTLSGPDGFELAAAELVTSAELLSAVLRKAGLGPGTRLLLGKAEHPLALIVLIAALGAGSDVDLSSASDELAVITKEGTLKLSYGWGGEPDGLLAALERVEGSDLAALTNEQRIYFDVGGKVASIRAAHFFEAASSLRHAVAPVATFDCLAGVADWLGALVQLARGSALHIG